MIDNCLTPAAKARAITQKAKEDHLLIRPDEIYSEISLRIERQAVERGSKVSYDFYADERGLIMENVIQRLINDGFHIKQDIHYNVRIIISWEVNEEVI